MQNHVYCLTLRTTADASTAHKAKFMIPFPEDSDFVGRPAIWRSLLELYAGSASRIALVGLGGIGYEHCDLIKMRS